MISHFFSCSSNSVVIHLVLRNAWGVHVLELSRPNNETRSYFRKVDRMLSLERHGKQRPYVSTAVASCYGLVRELLASFY